MNFFNGQCLVAMPGMEDSRFHHSVIYVCAHTQEGAMGLAINHPIKEISFESLLSQLNIEHSMMMPAMPPILAGGPMDVIRGFVLHSPEYTSEATMPMGQLTSLTVTTEVIRDISKGIGPQNFLIALGYAGWEAGQLEQEIKENAWLPVEASTDLLFTLSPEKKWDYALQRMGIDPLRLSSEQGKA